jgi:hypothetical protein
VERVEFEPTTSGSFPGQLCTTFHLNMQLWKENLLLKSHSLGPPFFFASYSVACYTIKLRFEKKLAKTVKQDKYVAGFGLVPSLAEGNKVSIHELLYRITLYHIVLIV